MATGEPAKIEETGGLTLVVPGAQIQADLSRVATLAVASGGFVASTQTQSAAPGTAAQGTMTLQIPEASFNGVLAEVRGLGRVASLTTSATDVTGQYVDLQARITALQDSRQQYLTIMAKATTIGGILAVQAQLQNLQSQLEQLQGQLQVLNNQTTYATLAVTLSQKAVTPPPPPKPESGLLKAWHAAVGGFVAGFEGVVRVAGRCSSVCSCSLQWSSWPVGLEVPAPSLVAVSSGKARAVAWVNSHLTITTMDHRPKTTAADAPVHCLGVTPGAC